MGKKYVTRSFSMTPEQAQALKELPNASEIVRRYVDMGLAARRLSEEAQARREWRFRIEEMMDELENLQKERDDYIVRVRDLRGLSGSNVNAYRSRALADFDVAVKELRKRIGEEMEKFLEETPVGQ